MTSCGSTTISSVCRGFNIPGRCCTTSCCRTDCVDIVTISTLCLTNCNIATLFYFCTQTFDLAVVYSICIRSARSQVHNLIICCAIAHGQVATSNLYCRCIISTTWVTVKSDGGAAVRYRVDTLQIFIQLEFQCICAISYYSDVTSCRCEAWNICCSDAFTLNFYKGTEFMSIYSCIIVTSEIQTFINQCIRCVLKVFYVYSCIWCVSSGCIQLS